MTQQERPDGYYWVYMKSSGKWHIAEYDNGDWYITGSEQMYDDMAFFEIGNYVPTNDDIDLIDKHLFKP